MTDNAQEGTPFEGAARPQAWVMRSLSPWIRRMATRPASRASITSGKSIGAQAAQQAHWLSRRADRIQRAAAWNGELGAVSPALVDRFAQRVANRVQRSARAHQVDAYTGGDNLDRQLDMPLVSNEGSLTPMSEGNSDETPFAFGSFSPENVQRKPVLPQTEAPVAPPPMSNALRERAEQLRRSLATSTPAPAIQPAHSAPSIQPSRAPATPGVTQAAPRTGVMRARPTTRIEELGPGKAPAPAPAMPPVPEPPKPSPAQAQRATQSPASRPSSATHAPNVQRTALLPQVVQGRGRLTQMLNARFRPKLDEARNPDAPRDDAGDFTPNASVSTNDDAPRISRSAMPPMEYSTPEVSDDLTPHAPVQRAPAGDTDSLVDVPIPTPKPRMLRKPALPVTKPPSTTALSQPAPAVQRKAEAALPSPAPLADAEHDAPATPLPTATPQPSDATSMASSTDVAPQVLRKVDSPALPPRQNITDDAMRGEPTGAPENDVPAIQREVQTDVARAFDLPLASPASKVEASDEPQSEPPAISTAPSVPHEAREGALPSSQTPSSQTPATQAAINIVQRSSAPASETDTPVVTPTLPSNAAPVDLTLHTPPSAPAANVDSPAEDVQRSAVTETEIPVTGDVNVVQRDAPVQASVSEAAQAQSESRSPITETSETVQRMTVNAQPTDAPVIDVAEVDQAMPLVQRAPAKSESIDAQTNAAPASAFAVVGAKQRDISHVNLGDQPAALPLHQTAPAQATDARHDVDANVGERSIGVIQRVLATPALRSDMPSAQTPSNPPAVQRISAPEMVLRSPASDASNVRRQTSSVMRHASVVLSDSPAEVGVAAIEPPKARRKAAPKSLSRMAGVAMADMPVLRTAAGIATDGVMQPEARMLAMPIVQRAVVKHEQQAMQVAQTRPVNPYVAAQEKAIAMPVVQRAPASDAPDVQRVEVDEPSPAPSSDAANAPAKARAITDAELTRAAQRILPIIKRMLAIERERLFGR